MGPWLQKFLSMFDCLEEVYHGGGDEVEETSHLLIARKQRKRGRGQGSTISFKDIPAIDLTSTMFHLLKVPSFSSSARGWEQAFNTQSLGDIAPCFSV